MREIIFRGKKVKTGEWVYGNYVHVESNELTEELPWHESVLVHDFIFVSVKSVLDGDKDVVEGFPVLPNTVGQFTGLKDKKGTLIYEGDIVLKRTYNGKKPFRVTFSGGMFHCGYGGGSSTPNHRYTLDDKSIEVIGNVHDNPELLQKKEVR